jgi:cobalamin-dependent methionine synthase I
MAREKGHRSNADLIIDPGLAAVSADTHGLVNRSLDAMQLIRRDPDLHGVHLMVGLTNVSYGMPEHVRQPLCNAYLTMAVEAGLDTVLGNPEHDPHVLEPQDPTLVALRAALEAGRQRPGESQEDAGMRQIEQLMELY